MTEPGNGGDNLRVSILLAQYEACVAHHLGFYSLIWQVPAVAVVIGGGLATIVFGTEMLPAVRILILLLGTALMVGMTVAFERFRMFQYRRRRDLKDLEAELAAFGARRLTWDGGEIARQVRSGELVIRGIPLYRIEGFGVLHGVMYLMTAALLFLTVLAIAALYGKGPLAGA
jgi:hypothetical protein